MWDYDKLFAVGNIIGFYIGLIDEYTVRAIDENQSEILHNCYKNELLAYPDYYEKGMETKIQYIIRLDEHGNVSEKIFDRERDIDSKKMPELKDGIFIRIAEKDNFSDDTLAYVDLNKDKLIFQDGGHESVSRISKWNFLKVVEVYDEDCINFDTCRFHKPIWRDFEYENYLEK